MRRSAVVPLALALATVDVGSARADNGMGGIVRGFLAAGFLAELGIPDMRLVFGAHDPKAGYCGSLGDIVRDPRLNHRLEVVAGVLADESALLLQEFFGRLRRATREQRAVG